MITHDDEREDRLLQEYHRAGDSQAGRPGDATRLAILEGARAAARRRQPAANDSRYAWSAAAGVAVIGIALLLWRQVDPRLADVPPASPGASGVQPVFTAEARREAAAEAEVVAQVSPAADATLAAPAAAAPAAPAAAATAAVAPADPGAMKLRDHFPEAWVSDSPPAMVWVVEDARGNLLRQGTLASGEALPALEEAMPSQAMRSAKAEASIANEARNLQSGTSGWTIQTTVNSVGVAVRFATAREPFPAPASTTEGDR